MGSNKEEALNILEDALTVYAEEEHSINTNNGILNDEYLNYHKRALLKKSVNYLTDEVVKHKQSYPKNDISDVNLTVDFVVLKANQYNKLMNLINNLDE